MVIHGGGHRERDRPSLRASTGGEDLGPDIHPLIMKLNIEGGRRVVYRGNRPESIGRKETSNPRLLTSRRLSLTTVSEKQGRLGEDHLPQQDQ